MVDLPALNSRDEFVRRTLVASLLASTGHRDEVHRVVEGQGGGIPATGGLTNARDAVLDAVARALCALVDRDRHAARLVAGVAAAHGDSPILDQRLRRFLPICYVLVPELRARWDEATLAPTHHKATSHGRLLVDLHAGRHVAPCDVDPGHVFTALPLAWSIELACRLHADRHPGGHASAHGSSTRFPNGAGRAAPPGRARVKRRSRRRRTICWPTYRQCRRSGSRSASSGQCRSRSTG